MIWLILDWLLPLEYGLRISLSLKLWTPRPKLGLQGVSATASKGRSPLLYIGLVADPNLSQFSLAVTVAKLDTNIKVKVTECEYGKYKSYV